MTSEQKPEGLAGALAYCSLMSFDTGFLACTTTDVNTLFSKSKESQKEEFKTRKESTETTAVINDLFYNALFKSLTGLFIQI